MSLSFWQLLLVAVLLLMLFGRGRITSLMGDLAGGIKSFKKGLSEDEDVDLNSPAVAKEGHAASSPEKS